MRIELFVWFPILGFIYAWFTESLIVLHEPYLRYQLMCFSLGALYLFSKILI